MEFTSLQVLIYVNVDKILIYAITLQFSESESCSVVSYSFWSHGLQSPWNSLGENTGMGSLSLLREIISTQGSNPDGFFTDWVIRKAPPVYWEIINIRTVLVSIMSWIKVYRLSGVLCVCAKLLPSCLTLPLYGLYNLPAPSVHGFSRQEYWCQLPFPSPGDLPNPGIKPAFPALKSDSLPTEPPGKPRVAFSTVFDKDHQQSRDFPIYIWTQVLCLVYYLGHY